MQGSFRQSLKALLMLQAVYVILSASNHIALAQDTNDETDSSKQRETCALNIDKTCDPAGECRYRLNIPPVNIGSLLAGENSPQSALQEKIWQVLTEGYSNQQAWQSQNQGAIRHLNDKIDVIENMLSKRLDIFTDNLTSSDSEGHATPTTAVPTAAQITQANEFEQIFRATEQNPSRAEFESRWDRISMEVERSKTNINTRVSNLENTMSGLLDRLEQRISSKIEEVLTGCQQCSSTPISAVPQGDQEEEQETEPTAEAEDRSPRQTESSEEPRMMLCRTCCEEVSFGEYLQSTQQSLGEYERNDGVSADSEHRSSVDQAVGVERVFSIERFLGESGERVERINTQIEEPPLNQTAEIYIRTEIRKKYSQSNLSTESWSATIPPPTGIYPSTVAHEITIPSLENPASTQISYVEGSGGSEESEESSERLTNSTRNINMFIRRGSTIINISYTDLPRDCADLYLRGVRVSGVYKIRPGKFGVWEVFCDMRSGGGGWTTIQRRMTGAVNFTRNWVEYRNGFGNSSGDYWLGLDRMNFITTGNRARRVMLRIDLTDWYGTTRHAVYRVFRVKGAVRNFELVALKYSGTAGDALNFGESYNHNLQPFTTYDRDNDGYSRGNCGQYYRSGWWFNACFAANLNGEYHRGQYRGVQKGIYWGTWDKLTDPVTNTRYSFKYVDMKVRPIRFNVMRRSSHARRRYT